jgi:hypothetical protein
MINLQALCADYSTINSLKTTFFYQAHTFELSKYNIFSTDNNVAM